MKRFIILLSSILLSSIMIGQEFEVRPSSNEARFVGVDGNVGIKMFLRETNNYNHGRLTINDEEDHAFIDMTYEKGGKMIMSEFEGADDLRSTLTNSYLSLTAKANELYRVSTQEGFEAMDGNGNVKYKITESGGFRAYDSNGNVSVRIRGNVSGDGRVSTDELEIMGGSDLSEYFDIVDEPALIEPGMIVSIQGENGKLAICNEARDRKVVGVVSGANGIETGLLMGQKGSIADGDYPIALTGRTYVYATTQNGAIQPGDFITTSSTPGYGMKVKKHKKAQGAIIGKAMTSLEEGSGMVLVLINLQ